MKHTESMANFGWATIAIVVSLASLAWGQATPTRVISLVPALTEMVFAIGAGHRVVAVSSYDEDPPQVRKLPRVGALLDPDVERIISLRSDLVLLYGSQTDLMAQLARASVPIIASCCPRPSSSVQRFSSCAI